MRLFVFIICSLILFLSGCVTMHFKPYPMKASMLTPYKSNASLNIINSQEIELVTASNSWKYNKKETTQGVVDQLRIEFDKAGVTNDANADKQLKVSVEGMNFPGAKIEFTVKVETETGLVKNFTERDFSLGTQRKCDFALAKVVASIYNDEEIRSYIEGKPYVPESDKKKSVPTGGNSAKERLQKLKELLVQGLISQNQFDKKSDEILSEM